MEYVYEHLLDWDLKSKHVHPRAVNASNTLDKYTSSSHYVSILEPLNLLECYASVKQVFDEFQESKKASRFGGFEFSILEVDHNPEDSICVDIFFGATQQEIDDYELFKSTLVVLTVPGSGEAKCLGLINDIGWNKELKKFEIGIRTRRSDWRRGARWTCCILTMMVTAERELLALKGIARMVLRADLLQATCFSFPHASLSEVEDLQKKYAKLNESQARAVFGAVNAKQGFSLIQGPPGTGKTSTIVSIIHEMLSIQSIRPLMFCAPSNAAVDELTKRLEAHFLNLKLDYKIVRIGREEAVDPEVAHLTLGGMMSPFFKKEAEEKIITEQLAVHAAQLGKKVDRLYARKDDLFIKMKSQFSNSSQEDIADTKCAVTIVQQDIADQRSELVRVRNLLWEKRNASRARKEAFTKKILQNADIFCCTLSGSGGSDVFNSYRKFHTVIIDEAGQCTEPSVLIPLQHSASKVILVGDPKQLPPTVISSPAGNFNYDQSLFVRMLKAHPDAMHTLDTQYRMHPDISLFPRITFYDGILKDGPGMADKTARVWHSKTHLAPYRFFNVEGQHKFGDNKSFYNLAEIYFADKLFSAVLQCTKNVEIGIVSPYKQQVEKLKNYFYQTYTADTVDKYLEISTVDGFQGREKDIIIMSCVRAHPKANSVGFLADVRRMNVAITRAKASLWIIGNATTLVNNEKWQSLVLDAHQRDMYCESSEFKGYYSVEDLTASFSVLGVTPKVKKKKGRRK